MKKMILIIIIKNIPKKKIFTFWEPKEKIPGYLQLCIKTWKKFLNDYEIIILDYKKVKEILGERLFNDIICKNMTLPIQADAIRVAVLNKFGGIWMDADTIIVNKEFLKGLDNFELAMLGDKTILHIGFIFASKKSIIIIKWLNEIINRVKNYKKISKRHKNKLTWNYLGNGIIDKIIINITSNRFLRLNKFKMNAFPELSFFGNTSLNIIEKYRLFYFQKRNPKILLENVKGIIMLHNSWTPTKYKKMSEKKFLKQDILISRLLYQILYIN